MHSRWYTIAVAGFWFVTMGWLVQQKVLPPLLVGKPPGYQSVIGKSASERSEVAWRLILDEEPIGWASTTTRRLGNGTTQLHNQVRVRDLPLAEMTPAWLRSLLRVLDATHEVADMTLCVDADSDVDIDPFGRLIGFFTVARLWQAPPFGIETGKPPAGDVPTFRVQVHGTVEGRNLEIKVRSGDLFYNTTVFLPSDALLSDALAPHARLGKLEVGQEWTVPVYSPLRPPTSPLEILHARVERKEPLFVRGQLVGAMLVVLRTDRGSELTGGKSDRARMWVDMQGNVVRQELELVSTRLRFERLAPGEVVFPRISDEPMR